MDAPRKLLEKDGVRVRVPVCLQTAAEAGLWRPMLVRPAMRAEPLRHFQDCRPVMLIKAKVQMAVGKVRRDSLRSARVACVRNAK